jgi:predicted DNA-binding protein (MmcQ/YjbR family)
MKTVKARVEDGHKGPAIVWPRHPDEAFGARERHFVRGTLNGVAFEGEIGTKRGVHYTCTPPALLTAAGVAPGADVEIRVEARDAGPGDPSDAPSLASAQRTSDAALGHVRAICLSLPDTKETPTWGKPHFRVGEKIFAGCGEEDGRAALGFKLEMAHAARRVKDARFWPAPYVGHKGWVSTDPTQVRDWEEIRALVLESYRLVAPKKSLAKLDGPPPVKATARRKRPTKRG